MHLWIVFAGVDLSRAFLDRPVDSLLTFVDCVHEYGSLACICGLCVRVWISRVHLWEDLILFSLHIFQLARITCQTAETLNSRRIIRANRPAGCQSRLCMPLT